MTNYSVSSKSCERVEVLANLFQITEVKCFSDVVLSVRQKMGGVSHKPFNVCPTRGIITAKGFFYQKKESGQIYKVTMNNGVQNLFEALTQRPLIDRRHLLTAMSQLTTGAEAFAWNSKDPCMCMIIRSVQLWKKMKRVPFTSVVAIL